MATELTLANLQQRISNLVSERDWDQFHSPKNLAIALSNEVAELLELYMWSDEPRKPEEVDKELADVLYYVLLFASKTKIDVLQALSEKLAETEVKYPVEKFKGNAKKYSDL
ncbi:MAG: nucleotide pyrophosphohydrolase [Patescibacteria group bacterium]|nr:nucleotide pyrophosphohydrolase [Patescibacteria group bacterium]